MITTIDQQPSHYLAFYDECKIENFFIRELNLEKSALESLEFSTEVIVISSLCTSLFVGTYFKSALYSYFVENYKDIFKSPINFLLLIQAIIQHSICLFMVGYYTLGLFLNIRFKDNFGEVFCHFPWYIQVYGAAYRNVGSLGIALFRILYIKCSKWVEEKAGEHLVCFIILVFSIAFSSILTLGFAMGNGPISRKQVTWNFCVGKSEGLREVIDQHHLLTGKTSPVSEVVPQLVVFVSLACVLMELACYLFFFGHIYFHEEGLLSREVLTRGEVKRRRRINAITFVGQFYGFIVECVFYFGIISFYNKYSLLAKM